MHDQVHAGRYSTEDEVISDALEQLRQHAQPVADVARIARCDAAMPPTS